MLPWIKRNRNLSLQKVGTLNVCVYILSTSNKSLINHFLEINFPEKPGSEKNVEKLLQ